MDGNSGASFDDPGSGTDYRAPQPFVASVNRRRFLQWGGAVAGAMALAGPGGVAEATSARASASAAGSTGTISDLKHVVILMQENRSFDHYYGSLQGVRGFGDKQAFRFQSGNTIFQQPDTGRSDGGYLLPWRMNSATMNAMNAGDLDHSWTGDHSARNSGLWNKWVSAKGEQSMGYLTRADLPFNYALADAFTICDGYHQAIMGPTSPNRMYFWTGTSSGATTNPADYTVKFTNVKTYPEQLTAAGISWQVYTNHEVGDGSGADGWVGDYGDNPLWFYKQYQTSMKANTTAGQQLAIRGAVQPWQASAGTALGPNHVNHVLAQFQADCAAGTIPQVSWIVAPYSYSEHPAASPAYGAHYTRAVLEALMGNQALWESTALFVTYDEHDGYFDHTLPPAPETSYTNEFISSQPIGMGTRVPMLICSPWTRGGWVDSNTYDHTSMNRFLQTWTGAPLVNVTAWRNLVSSDLTAAFDFANPDFSIPALPDTVPLINQSDAAKTLPAVKPPASGAQVAPVQEAGTRQHRPTRHMPHADVAVNRSTGVVTATMSNTGSLGVSLFVFPDQYLTASATPFTVVNGTNKTYTWNTSSTSAKYAFSIYGPDRFVRSFVGTVVAASQTTVAVPQVSATPVTAAAGGGVAALKIALGNAGQPAVTYTLTPNDYAGTTQTVPIALNGSATITWPVDANGYYDVIVKADTADGYTRRYAGRIQ
ncbi:MULTISPECIES: phosphocholine-specific phospholipase C [unclassified Frankia]|uniref:phosphocholine-specific phospholipase C n=1 Tax=unclassified Frankia TaxID=2632575 RepID=UPI001934A93B|nr:MULTISPECIES: phospholipase C, phosphocholine-specific [unclassified Frankia]MBL7490235.1 phospholipase C, phosphocholine-specific [Frankia sp. AgW1.1]MBL7623493.1 phospholipase C, phosphocholine-specific [Frankia sp. AgB1.8]